MSDQTPVSVPLSDKTKEELIRIIEMTREDEEYFRTELNKLRADLDAQVQAATAAVLEQAVRAACHWCYIGLPVIQQTKSDGRVIYYHERYLEERSCDAAGIRALSPGRDALDAMLAKAREPLEKLVSDLSARLQHYESNLVMFGPVRPMAIPDSNVPVQNPETTTVAAMFKRIAELESQLAAKGGRT